MSEQPLTYEASGVSIAAQDEAIAAFKAKVAASCGPEVLAGVGSFGAAVAPDLSGMAQPVFVSSTDGIGTKVQLHARFNTHAWAGADLVAAVTNDVICSGARPLFFLDYFACHSVVPEVVSAAVGGMADECSSIGCALVGGEIAEMGSVYQPDEFDLAGFGVGLVDRQKMLGSHLVETGDLVIGVASSGAHCNGFSLIRRVFENWSDAEWVAEVPELGDCLRDALLRPTRSYSRLVSELAGAGLLRAAAHISGGGLQDNLPRALPEHLGARVARSAIPPQSVFAIIQRLGQVDPDEMWHVLNMGVGFCLITRPSQAGQVLSTASELGFAAWEIGAVIPRDNASGFAWLS